MTSTSAAPAMTQAAIKKLVADSVAAALEAQAATMANANNTNRNTVKRKLLNCTEDCKVNFATGTLTEETLSCEYFATYRIEEAYLITWVNSRSFDKKKLETLCPTMVPNTEKHMEAFIGGLPRSIEGNVSTSKPQTLEEAINITQRLLDQ
ncbi:hypothetical protein Tco_1342405, partial [Tanacetum coccineum]